MKSSDLSSRRRRGRDMRRDCRSRLETHALKRGLALIDCTICRGDDSFKKSAGIGEDVMFGKGFAAPSRREILRAAGFSEGALSAPGLGLNQAIAAGHP